MPKFIFIRGKAKIGSIVRDARGLEIGRVDGTSRNEKGELVEVLIAGKFPSGYAMPTAYVRYDNRKTAFQAWNTIGDNS